MKTWIYRCSNKPDLYLYLAEQDDFSRVPAKILNSMGRIELAMELNINEQTKLARVNPRQVLHNLSENGFHLQLPPSITTEQLIKQIADQ